MKKGGKNGPTLDSNAVRKAKKEERKRDIVKNYTCKKAIYEHCKLLAPDGACLSNCDLKKARWYVDKGLAAVEQEEPLIVKLNFEPRDRVFDKDEDVDEEFYSTEKENRCVMCGSTEDQSRFSIIPSMYRTHFPAEIKSHNAHDVVIMCFSCHEVASRR